MVEIVVRTEKGWKRHVRPSVEQLLAIADGLGPSDSRFLIVQRIPDLPDDYFQTWHEDGEAYTVEYRAGGADRHYEAVVDGPEAVVAAIASWADRSDGWDAGLEWSRLELDAPAPAEPLSLSDEDHRSLVDRVRTAIVAGYDTRAELTELATDYLVTKENQHPVSKAQAEELVDRMWLEQVAEQSGWEGETDPDRLTRAFEALDAAGVTARQNFADCRTCGQAEIGAVGSADARGFVYFHSQCTDSAVAGLGLMLLYGGFDGSEDTAASIGREVVAALGAVGLRTEWDGSPGTPITIRPLDWRKRLVG